MKKKPKNISQESNSTNMTQTESRLISKRDTTIPDAVRKNPEKQKMESVKHTYVEI